MSDKHHRIVILTGAGISAESGIPTFRDGNGLWENHDVDVVATPEGFASNPDLVHRFYNERRQSLLAVSPNPAHFALARLEKEFKGSVLIITQNIDGLHQAAASKNVIELHGSLRNARCPSCGNSYPITENTTLDKSSPCLHCNSVGQRPDVVWFSEMPHHLDLVYDALSMCTIFIQIGTSGQVQPASDFVDHVWESGCRKTVEINTRPTRNRRFMTVIQSPASIGVVDFVDDILKQQSYLRP